MILFLILLAFYVAWNLGANDVANSMGTSVGSKALSLRQALIVAGILEFSGAVLFGQGVSATLSTQVVNPTLFAGQPNILLAGMIAVMIACGVWLQVATSRGWPVASSHAVVGAIAGFSWVAAGVGAVSWSDIGIISLTWLLTPFVSGLIAAGFYRLIQRWILTQPDPLQQLREWIPWLSAALLSVFGVIVLPKLSDPIHQWIVHNLGWQIPLHDIPLILGVGAATGLTWVNWRQLDHQKRVASTQSPQSAQTQVEQLLGRFQVLSACFVAFAHGSNDVGNAIAPLATINYIRNTGTVPLAAFPVPLWILILGGAGIVAGLAILGKNVITTVGENIIPLQPSSGFCAELATATTVLMASRLGLPVSTSHALVGGVLGIGLIQRFATKDSQVSIGVKTLQGIFLAWVVTVPVAAGLSAGLFLLIQWFF
jgi:PiT family inorganic phosphate transporter